MCHGLGTYKSECVMEETKTVCLDILIVSFLSLCISVRIQTLPSVKLIQTAFPFGISAGVGYALHVQPCVLAVAP